MAEMAWRGRYPKLADPVKAANYIADPNSKSSARKRVLLAGLSVWVIAPTEPGLRSSESIRKAHALYGQSCEKLALARGSAKDKSQNGWTVAGLKVFHKSVFEPLGGWHAIDKLLSVETTTSLIKAAYTQQQLALRMVEIMHYLVSDGFVGKPGANDKLAIDICKELASTIGLSGQENTKHASASTFGRAWDACRSSIAFSYAASKTQVPKHGTILDLISDRKLTADKVASVFRAWMSRVKFVDETILRSLHSGKGNGKPRFVDLAGLKIDPLPLPPPQFDARAIAFIRACYPKRENQRR